MEVNKACPLASLRVRFAPQNCPIGYAICTDILSALYVCITVFIIVAKRKEIFRLFDDFWNRYLPAKEAGENPPYDTFDCKEQD